jgi:integral membrane protein
MDATFRRYRAMSFVTGTTLLLLFADALLRYIDSNLWHHNHLFRVVVGVGHGIVLYPIYMITCFNVVLRHRLNLGLLVLMFLAGFVPGLAFYLEYRMRRHLFPEGSTAA